MQRTIGFELSTIEFLKKIYFIRLIFIVVFQGKLTLLSNLLIVVLNNNRRG